MKRYSISKAEYYNDAKVKFCYWGRTEKPEEVIKEHFDNPKSIGLRITDSTTKKVVYENIRKAKGCLIITYTNGNQRTEYYCDLNDMRYWEQWHTNRNNKVERKFL